MNKGTPVYRIGGFSWSMKIRRSAISTTTTAISIVVIVIIAGVAAALYLQGSPATSTTTTTTTTTTTAAPALKVAEIMPGLASDGDYNTLGALALSQLHNDTGAQVKYSDNVAVPDAATVMQQYISQGYQVIWVHGGQFDTAVGMSTDTSGLAATYPNVNFIVENDAPITHQRSNVWNINRNFATGYYAIGAAAALATKTNKIAYIGGVQLPFSNAEANAAIAAAKSVNPQIQVYRYWSSNFNDPVGAQTQTKSMIALGVDVVMSSTNLGVYGIFKAVNGTSVLVTTKYTDKLSYAPNNYITSYEYNFAPALEHIYSQIQNNVTTGYYTITFGSTAAAGCGIQMPLHNEASTANTKVSNIISGILDGSITVGFNATAPGPGP